MSASIALLVALSVGTSAADTVAVRWTPPAPVPLVALRLDPTHVSTPPPAGSLSPRRDRFFGEDKGKHFFVSFMATVLAGSAARAAGFDGDASATIGAGASLALGVGKEIADLRTPGASASLLDLLWDAGGAGAGYVVLTRVQ